MHVRVAEFTRLLRCLLHKTQKTRGGFFCGLEMRKLVKEKKLMKLKTLEILEKRHEPMSVKEIAKILGDSRSHIYRLIHDGEICGVFRVGWLIRVWPSGVLEYLNKQAAKGSSPQRRMVKPSDIWPQQKSRPRSVENIHQSLNGGDTDMASGG